MFPFLIPLKNQVDAAPPQQTKAQLENLSGTVSTSQVRSENRFRDIEASQSHAVSTLGQDLHSAKTSVAALQASQGTLAKDLAFVRGEVSQKTGEVAKTVAAVQAKVDAVSATTQQASTEAAISSNRFSKSLGDTKSELTQQTRFLFSQLEVKQYELDRRNYQQDVVADRVAEALSDGNVHWVIDSAAENVSAALLNAAPAGSFKKTFVVEFCSQFTVGEETQNRTHVWASKAITPTKEKVGEGFALPTIGATSLYRGLCTVEVTFATGGGNVYAEGNTVTVNVPFAGDNKWLGLIAVAAVAKVYTVVA